MAHTSFAGSLWEVCSRSGFIFQSKRSTGNLYQLLKHLRCFEILHHPDIDRLFQIANDLFVLLCLFMIAGINGRTYDDGINLIGIRSRSNRIKKIPTAHHGHVDIQQKKILGLVAIAGIKIIQCLLSAEKGLRISGQFTLYYNDLVQKNGNRIVINNDYGETHSELSAAPSMDSVFLTIFL